jgi:hypothetical protein
LILTAYKVSDSPGDAARNLKLTRTLTFFHFCYRKDIHLIKILCTLFNSRIRELPVLPTEETVCISARGCSLKGNQTRKEGTYSRRNDNQRVSGIHSPIIFMPRGTPAKHENNYCILWLSSALCALRFSNRRD